MRLLFKLLIIYFLCCLGFTETESATACPQGDNLCPFEEYVNMYFIAGDCDDEVEIALDGDDVMDLANALHQTYDLFMSTIYCDSPFFRDVTAVEATVGGWNPSCASQGGIVIPPEDYFVPIQFLVSGTFCASGPCELADPPFLYDLPKINATSFAFQEDQTVCSCDSTFGPFFGLCRAPYEYEFVNAFRQTVESLGLNCFKSVGECNFDTLFSTHLTAAFKGNGENVTIQQIEEVIRESLNEVYQSNDVTCNAESHVFEIIQAGDNSTIPSFDDEFILDFGITGICNGCAHELDFRDETLDRRLANDPSACGASVLVSYETSNSKCFCSPDIPIFDWSANRKLVAVYGEVGEDGEGTKSGVTSAERPKGNDIEESVDRNLQQDGIPLDSGEFVETTYDVCEGAISLQVGDLFEGSTVRATSEILEGLPCGDEFPSNAPGVWLTVEGTGDAMVASCCTSDPSLNGFDSQISVFEGECGELKCVAGNNDDVQLGCSTEATVSWGSKENVLYYLYVFGRSPSGAGEVGDFGLQIDNVLAQSLSLSIGFANDFCEGALHLEVDDIVQGSTVGASYDGIEDAPCGDENDRHESPGVWYSVIGTGNMLIVTTCTSENSQNTDFNTEISVFEGDCDDLDCITGNHQDDTDTCSDQAGVRWLSEKRTTYFILVFGDDGETGDFALEIIESTVLNDFCFGAIEIGIDDVIEGTTNDAIADDIDGLPCDSEEDSGSPGVWYKVLGTGDRIYATTCTSDGGSTGFSPQISVFEGDCESLECIAGNADDVDDECDNEAGVVWDSVDGTMYYILVFGDALDETGDFFLEVLEPDYDFCLGAVEVEIGVEYSGSTVGASYDPESADGCGETSDNGQAGVWYKVVGTGGELEVTTCVDSDDWDSQIIVFDGDCTSLTCVDDNDDYDSGDPSYETGDTSYTCPSDDPAKLSFSSTDGTTYYILVFGHSSESDFDLVVENA